MAKLMNGNLTPSKGREIESEYWGHSELFERLGKKENEGKLYYWFWQEEFSEDWFTNRLQESIRNSKISICHKFASFAKIKIEKWQIKICLIIMKNPSKALTGKNTYV
jgi:hypothetical protein